MAKSKSKSKLASKRPKISKRSKRSKRSKSSKGSKSSSSKNIAYCVVCKKKVKMIGCKLTKSVKGQPMLKGKCSVCGTGVNRFVKKGTKSC